jgi:hypothetical protein
MLTKDDAIDFIIENAIKRYKSTGIGCEIKANNAKNSIGLIYPKIYKKEEKCEPRISEQELKTLFCAELIDNNKNENKRRIFSLETPTIAKYSFKKNRVKDKKYQSGNIDVCIHEFTGENCMRKSNIEFKAHNEGDFLSDFAKLMGETGDNYFIHVLESMDNGTLYKEKDSNRKAVINKYLIAIDKINKNPGEYIKSGNSNEYNKITFYICILDKNLKPSLLLKNTINRKNDISKIEDKLELKYTIKEEIFSFNKEDKKNWEKINI